MSNEIVQRVIDALDANAIPYMVVGSLSTNTFGVERSTKDADFVIELGDKSISIVADKLGPDLKLDPQMSIESVTMSYRYMIKHSSSGFTVELFLRGDDPFQRVRFERRQKRPFLTSEAWLPTAEDTVIQKLRWYGRAKRSKDRDDARNVLAVQLKRLDLDYIRNWCDEHGTREELEGLIVEVQRFQ
jgi:hypothetical protein